MKKVIRLHRRLRPPGIQTTKKPFPTWWRRKQPSWL